jgi:hypothetical protein
LPDYHEADTIDVVKREFLALLMVGIIAAAAVSDARAQGSAKFRPAMIGQGAGSVASELHYPPKQSAAKKEGAITFYCEVMPDGKPAHVGIVCAEELAAFREAADRAFARGHFVPAAVNGQPVSVSVGGTIMFLMRTGQPTIAVSLATADRKKVAALGNYIQPQMIGTNVDFRRKLFHGAWDIHFLPAPFPSAEVLAEVDADGNLKSTKVVRENPPNGGYGRALLKGFEGATFIPAFDNGKPVAGEFNWPFNFKQIHDPDYGAPVGTRVPRDL